MNTLAIPNLEEDCAERDAGDDHQHTAGIQGMAGTHSPAPAGSIPAPATKTAASQARIRVTHSDGAIMVFFTDGAGYRTVVMQTLEEADATTAEYIDAMAGAERIAEALEASGRG